VKAPGLGLAGKAAELARAFDAGFAEAPASDSRNFEDVLAIRLGGDPYALRLGQVAGLYARRTIVPLPSALPELLGLASVRAAVVPVYDISALLGRLRQSEPRWIVVAAQAPIGLAFDELEGFRRLEAETIVAEAASTPGTAPVELIRSEEQLRPLLHLPALIEVIVQRAEQARKAKGV
jgi:chemotaxis signal transduction protein